MNENTRRFAYVPHLEGNRDMKVAYRRLKALETEMAELVAKLEKREADVFDQLEDAEHKMVLAELEE